MTLYIHKNTYVYHLWMSTIKKIIYLIKYNIHVYYSVYKYK